MNNEHNSPSQPAQQESKSQAPLPWLKLYSEIIDNPKLAGLPDAVWRLWIEVLCLARRSSVPGEINMTVKQIAWTLRRPEAKVKIGLAALADAGLVIVEPERVIVRNFIKRQSVHPSDLPDATRERKQRQRENEKLSQQAQDEQSSPDEEMDDSHDHVTTDVTTSVTTGDKRRVEREENRVDQEEEKEKEKEKEVEREPECVNLTLDKESRAIQAKNTHTFPPSITNYSQLSGDNLSRNGALSPDEQANEQENAPTTAPDKIEITPERWQWASERGWTLSEADLDHATLKMLAFCGRSKMKFVDWDAQWRLWVLTDIEKARKKEAEELKKPILVPADKMNVNLDRRQVREAIERCELTDEDVEEALEFFKNHYDARGAERADWSPEFANWLLREAKKEVYGWK